MDQFDKDYVLKNMRALRKKVRARITMMEAAQILLSKEEIRIAELAIRSYRRYIELKDQQCEFLKNKKFHMGDIVVKNGTGYFDKVFNTEDGNIGRIVGWDYKFNYYRVYFSEENPFMGIREERLVLHTGEVPKYLSDYNPKVTAVTFQFR